MGRVDIIRDDLSLKVRCLDAGTSSGCQQSMDGGNKEGPNPTSGFQEAGGGERAL
jgi:hypothetical protein